MASTAVIFALPGREFFQIAEPSTKSGSNLPSEGTKPTRALPQNPDKNLPTPEVTNSIPRLEKPADVSALKQGLDRLTSRDITGAIAIRDRLGRQSTDGQILSWAIALSGQSAVSSSELQQTIKTLGPFPGKVTIEANIERALLREAGDPATIVALFAQTPPQTIDGKLSLAKALSATKRTDEALAVIRPLWQQELLSSATEAEILTITNGALSQDDHRKRYFMLAYRGRLNDAKRVSEKAGTAQLHAAWAAVEARGKDASKLISEARATWKDDPALSYIELRQKRMAWDYPAAANILRKVEPADIANSSPSAWWNEMRIVARGLIDLKNYKRAYQLIAAHPAVSETEAFDAEFHAGWLALRYLNDANTAEPHFRKMLSFATTPISVAKTQYWLGRTLETSNMDAAKQHLRLAANHSASFYGMLAANRLGDKANPVELPHVSDEDRILLAGQPLMHAIERLEKSGYGWRADILYRTLGSELDRPGELALLTRRLEARGAHQVSLQVGRSAYNRGIYQTALAFPISAIPQDANIGAAGKALAFAIARQESSFDVAAISPANAQGLLQILPGTAKEVAGRMKINFEPARLTSDAAYNATLGAQYLSEQITKFDGSYILTFIAYNAGPRRVDEWIKRYGDPSKLALDDVIDWIERIPYPETRTYVQRVMENYQVYKARLGKNTDIASDLTKGRQ